MLVELSIVPLGCDVQWSDQLAEALKLVDASGLPYLLTPSGTCIEGEWDEVMALARIFHPPFGCPSADNTYTFFAVFGAGGAVRRPLRAHLPPDPQPEGYSLHRVFRPFN